MEVEGPAAKAYFHTLFGLSFSREDGSEINARLNYGYSILASMITKEIVSHGYSPQLGIHHHSGANPFNLTYDFIEPWRPLVDLIVARGNECEFDFEQKTKMVSELTNSLVQLNGKSYVLTDAISEFARLALHYLNEGITELEVSY